MDVDPALSGSRRLPPAATLLIVEDDDAVRRVLERLLVRFGYRVLSAADGEEALSLLGQHRAAVDLVISDASMPKMTGPELYRALRASGNAVRFLFASAGTIDAGADPADQNLRVLPKPYNVEELVRAVREMLAA